MICNTDKGTHNNGSQMYHFAKKTPQKNQLLNSITWGEEPGVLKPKLHINLVELRS